MKNLLTLIPIDKQIHCLLCYFLYDNLSLINWWVALIIVLSLIIGKEWYDYKDYGHFCWWDILAGMVGVFLSVAHILLFH